jgi:hypothetical protein
MSVRLRGLPHLRSFLVGAVTISTVAAGIGVSGAASAETRICDQYGTATVGGRYIAMNNRWGSPGPQCISVTDNGFVLSQQDGQGNLSGAPASYPAIYLGCHYSACSPNSPLPARIGSTSSVTSKINYKYVQDGIYDAAYDIWLDPTAKKDGVNKTEIMIWFNHTGSVQPVGTAKGTVTVGGRTWTVWTGNNGGNDVVSYVAPAAIESWNFSVMDFIKDTISRGFATDDWYLTSLQAGFEPWSGGAGLAVTSFSADVNGGAGDGSGGTDPAPTPSSTTSSALPQPGKPRRAAHSH